MGRCCIYGFIFWGCRRWLFILLVMPLVRGDTKRPLKYLSMAALNIILNLFFVIVCKMDVAGVAVSSIISQYLSAAMIGVGKFFRKGDIYDCADRAKV